MTTERPLRRQKSQINGLYKLALQQLSVNMGFAKARALKTEIRDGERPDKSFINVGGQTGNTVSKGSYLEGFTQNFLRKPIRTSKLECSFRNITCKMTKR